MKKIFIYITVAAFMLAPAAVSANEWICRCGCGDPLCINIEGICYKYNGSQALYEKGSDEYEDVSNKNGTITHTWEGVVVDNVNKNHLWSYYFEIAPSSRHYLHWDGELEVVAIEGASSAGIVMEGESRGINFQVDRHGRALLGYIVSNVSADTIEEFFLPKELRERVKGSFTLGLEYDIRTSVLVAKIDEVPVKKVVLPYFGIPATVSVVGYSMQVSNPAHTSIGSVTYGDFSAEGSNDFFENTLL